MSKYLNKYLTKEYIQMANEHTKRCSTSYAIRKLQIKATVSYHHIPIRPKSKTPDNTKCW